MQNGNSKELVFRFSMSDYSKTPLYFVGVAEFVAMNKEDNTMKRKLTNKIDEQRLNSRS